MSQHYDNPVSVSYSVDLLTTTSRTLVFAPPPGKTRGRLVNLVAAISTAVVATTAAPTITVGVSGDTDREASLTIPNTQGAGTSLSVGQNALSSTQGFGFGQGNPNDQTVDAAAENVHVVHTAGTGGLVAGAYVAVVTIEWF